MSRFQCPACRDRGYIPTSQQMPDGTWRKHDRLCPQCSVQVGDDERTDNGDGLPTNYAVDYVTGGAK